MYTMVFYAGILSNLMQIRSHVWSTFGHEQMVLRKNAHAKTSYELKVLMEHIQYFFSFPLIPGILANWSTILY